MALTVRRALRRRLLPAAAAVADAGADRRGRARARHEPAAAARRGPARARADRRQLPAETFADPLPQALALTAMVITFALTTFLLALGYRSFGADRPRRGAGRHRGPPDRRGRRWRPTGRRPLDEASGDEPAEDDGESRRRGRRGTAPTTGRPRRRRSRAPPRPPTVLPPRAREPCRAAVLLPILGAALTVVLGSSVAVQRIIALTTLAAVAGGRGRAARGASTAPARVVTAPAAGRRRSGITLVADRLSALMLLVASLMLLAVLVYAIGQRSADAGGGADVGVPAGVPGARGRGVAVVPDRRPVQPVRRVRDDAHGAATCCITLGGRASRSARA